MSSTWEPDLYLRFGAERERPARDLVARVDHPAPRTVVDLGCGTGDLGRALARRWPDALVVGLDHSREMLAHARAAGGAVSWVRADLARWRPRQPVDVLVSNAALHWAPDHARLVPDLLACVAPGGTLAFQVPDNDAEPSHVLLRRLLDGDLGGERFGDPALRARVARRRVLPPAAYLRLLAPLAREVDVWRTVYYQRLSGADPVLEWLRSTALRPVTEALAPDARERYLAAYAKYLREAYPREEDGTTLLPFPRLFVVARR